MHTYCYRITIEGVLGSVGRRAFEEFSIVSNNGHTSLIAPISTRRPFTVR
jgi:hypothetical protein